MYASEEGETSVIDGDLELLSLIVQIYTDNELVDVEKLDLTVEEGVQKFGGREGHDGATQWRVVICR